MTTQRQQIAAYFFFAFFLYILYQLFRIFSPFFQPFFWGAVLAFAFYPVQKFLVRLFKGNYSVAALLSTLCIIAVVITPTLMMLKSMVVQAIQLYQRVSSYISQGGIEGLILRVQSLPWFQSAQTHVSSAGISKDRFSEAMLQFTQYLANTATALLTDFTKNIFVVSFQICLMVIVIFIFFRSGEKMYRWVYDLIPMDPADREALAGKITNTFAGVIRGQFLTSLAQAVLAGFTFLFLGFPAPSLFGLATFLTTLIPILGASTVWVPAAIYLFIVEETKKAIILTAVGILVISLSDNIIKPILVGDKTKIPASLLFLAILGSVHVYGFTGIFLGPVIITILFALVEIYRGRYQ